MKSRTSGPRSGLSAPLIGLGAGVWLASGAGAQLALVSNGGSDVNDPGLATAMVTYDNTPAPPGALWSEVPADGLGFSNAVAGFSAHQSTGGGYRFGDDFTVTSPTGWRLVTVSFYAYQIGAPDSAAPVSGVNLRVWNGPPGDAGSTVVFGDTATNRLVYAEETNIYRVFNSTAAPQPQPPDIARLVWRCDADGGGVVLPPGTYWLDWQFQGGDPGAAVLCPPVTIYGLRAKAGANAVQLRSGSPAWVGLVDYGKPASGADFAQDLPFIVRGGVMPQACIADINGDGFTDGIDYDEFFWAFEFGLAAGDVNGDGYVDGIDSDQFMLVFEQGC